MFHNNFKFKTVRSKRNEGQREIQYNLTLLRVHSTIFAVEQHYVMHIMSVCSLRYPACNAHAPYCHMWPIRLYIIFPLLRNRWISEEVIEREMCVLIFSKRLSETFLILREIERDIINMY